METKNPLYLPKTWGLPEAIIRRLGDQPGRQRLMDEEGHLLLILHRPPRPEDDAVRSSVFFWRNPEGLWKSAPEPGGLSALQDHLGAFRAAVLELDEQVDSAQEPMGYFEVMRAINPLLRSSRNLLAVMEEARRARSDERRLILFRDEAVEIERGAELLANDAKAGMEFTLAESGQRQAEEAFRAANEARRLNHLVAFFFPLATLVAIFGMNEPGEVYRQSGFWMIILVGIGFGLLTRKFMGGRRR